MTLNSKFKIGDVIVYSRTIPFKAYLICRIKEIAGNPPHTPIYCWGYWFRLSDLKQEIQGGLIPTAKHEINCRKAIPAQEQKYIKLMEPDLVRRLI